MILDAFQSKQRSDTIILVKNIPYGTTTSELSDLFSPHGEIVRLLLPPAGTMAVVELSNSAEASKAFRAVAYRRLKNSIVYLEKAPIGLFKEGEDTVKRITSGVKPIVAPTKNPSAMSTDDADSPVPVESGDTSPELAATGATLFVKNLNFSTNTDKLVKTFHHLPSFAFARVQMKPNPKQPGAIQSMGYGFVGFKDRDAAQKAMGTMEGFVLDGHALVVKFAQRGLDDNIADTSVATKSKTPTTKVIVKNLPFEATKKDIGTLFGYVPRHVLLSIITGRPLMKQTLIGITSFYYLSSTVHMANSNRSDYQRSSMLAHEDSLS